MKLLFLLPLVVLLLLNGEPPARAQADTPAQAQQAMQAACNRASSGYSRRDLPSIMAMYAPDYVLTNVVGRKYNYRTTQADAAAAIARDDYHVQGHGTISQVTLHGQTASAVARWHFTDHHLRSASAPAYTYTSDYTEQSLWKKTAGGWQEVKAQATHDVSDFRR